MAESRAFFEQRREWSQRKHEAFAGYVPQFTRILGRDRGSVYLVDAFAGRGYYVDGVTREPGSPILAAQIAKRLAEQGEYDLRCINVEADPDVYADLVTNTTEYSTFVTNLQGTFGDHIDSVLHTIGRSPTLFFLDPFGVGGLEWATLAKIAARAQRAKTEILLNLNVPKFDRHAGWLDSFEQKPRAAFISLLDRTIGSPEWQKIWDEPLVKDERYRRIIDLYLNRIEHVLRLRCAAYPIRTVEDEYLKYHLVFASRHPLAMRIMSSIFYGIEQRFLIERAKLQAQRPRQLTLLPDFLEQPPSLDELERQSVMELQNDVLTAIRRSRAIRFGHLQDVLVDKWFGRMVEKHFREVCRNLANSDQVAIPTRGIGDNTVLRLKG